MIRNLIRQSALALLFLVAVSAVMAQSKIYYVSPTGNGTADGSSWTNTMTLTDALTAAKAGDQIWVKGFEQIDAADKLYIVPTGSKATGFTLKSGVQLYGGFAGTEASINDRETLGKPYQLKYRSVLSGDISKNDALDNTNLIFPANMTRNDNATHVLSINMVPSSSGNNNNYPTVVNGFSIGGGQADGEKGGGIYIFGDNTNGGIFRIERCFFVNNFATQGGAIYVADEVQNQNNNISLINQCVIYNNAAGERAAVENAGGGIYLAGEATVVNSSIFNNENGGIRLSGGAKVVNSTVARNTSGGIDMITAVNTYNVYNTIVWGNSNLFAEYRPNYKSSAFHEVSDDDSDGNVYVATENNSSTDAPLFDAPSVKTSYDRDFDWSQTAYPLWSWDVLEGSVMIDKGDNNNYQTATYGSEDMAGDPRMNGSNIDIGAYEYQHLATSRIRYVKQGGTGDGSSWANASGNIQNMIDELATNNPQNQPGEVWVAAGTYAPQSQLISGTAYSASFRMRDGISVYGGFEGTETSKLDRAQGTMPWDFTNQTILQAAYYDHNDFAWNNNKWTQSSDSRHVVWFAPMPGEAEFSRVTTLDGVTIQGGYAQGGTGLDDFLTDRGAGVYMDGANAYLTNCVVKENYATGNGGGVYLKNGRVQTSLIYNNSADADGGAVYVENRGLVLRSMLANNSAHNGAGAYLYNGAEADPSDDDHPEYLILSTCVVSNNTVTGNGAVYCDKGGVLMQNTIANNNCVTATDATDVNASRTGGIYIDEYALVVNSVIWNNQMGRTNGTNIPMYARNPSASKVRFLYNAISGVNNAVWNYTLQEQTLSLVDENAGTQNDNGSIGPRFTEPTTDMNFDLEKNYGVQESWKDDIISYYWKPINGSNLWARGMALGQLPDDVVLAPEVDIEGALFAQKPAVGAFTVVAPGIAYDETTDPSALIVYVDIECTEPDHKGNSWETAYRSLNDAISYLASLNAATVGTRSLQVHVLEGDIWPRYAFSNNDPKTATITVPVTASGQAIYIYGGYYRDNINNTVSRDPLNHRSVINGNTEGKDITAGLYHCITVQQNAKLVLDGFHVINGYAAGEASRQYGAGLLAHSGSTVTVRNCIFENNTAEESAAIDARDATLTLQNCVVNNNTNTDATKPVVNAKTLTMQHVTVVNNVGAAPENTNNLYASSFSAGNSSNNTQTLASTGEAGAVNFANPTNKAGATLGFDTYLGGYSEFRPLTSSTEAGIAIINQASTSTSTLSTDITVVNDRDLGGVPDLGAYEADLPKAGRIIYVRVGGNGDGLSWGSAMGDINAAVLKAVEYNNKLSNTDKYDADKRAQVWVAAGTYEATPEQGSDNCFVILEGVDVYGAFPKTGNPGMNDRHPFISSSVYIEGTYSPDDYETILKPSSNYSGNRRVLGQEDKYNPINTAQGGQYIDVGTGNGNYVYQANSGYKEVGSGEGDYIFSEKGNEYVSAAAEYCEYLKIEEADHYYKYVSNAEITLYDINYQNEKKLVYVGSSYGNYNISTTGGWWSRDYYSLANDGSYVEFKGAGWYESSAEEGQEQSIGSILNVPKGSGNVLLTQIGYNNVGTGYGNYVYVTQGYHKVEQGQGNYIYTAENRFGVETIWDGFTLTKGYLDSNYLSNLSGQIRNGGAGAAIFTNVVLKNCIVTDNTNTSTNTGKEIRGGGVYCDEGMMVNCYILNNTLGRSSQYTAYGGGCYMYRGTAYNSVISENKTIGQHADGAGIFIENAAFYNNTIVKNTADATTRGNGGICIWTSGTSSQLTIYNCIVLGNSGRIGDMTGTGDIAVSSNGGYINCNYSITSDVTNASRGNGAVTYNNSVVRETSIFADYAKGNYRLGSMDGANMGIDEPTVNGNTIVLSEYTDMDFTDRIKDCRVDAGAYERDNSENIKYTNSNGVGIYYVSQNGAGMRSGENPANAACAMKLQDILNAAGAAVKASTLTSAIVKVAGYQNQTFVYHPNTLSNPNDPQSYTYVVPEGIIVEGGYNEDFTERNPLEYPTVLSAISEASSSTIQTVNGYHAVTFGVWPGTTALSKPAIIDGLWLIDGSATSMAGTGNSNTWGGGAIVPSGAHVRNCVVTNCEAIEGGGLYLLPGATVSGTAVIGCEATNGAGIYADNTDADNTEVDKDSPAHILSCTIANNEASSTGGGLYMEDGAVMSVNTVVFDNRAGSDKNVSGVVSQQFEDSKLATVYGITGTNSFYPFNNCFVETQEMPSDFENIMLDSDKSLYFIKDDDHYRLKDYSLLIKHGLKNEYQTALVATFNVATQDMQNIERIQTGNGAERLDAGAFAYEGGILPTDLFTRIFVSPTSNVTLPEGENMNNYLGRSFYTSFSTLEDALGYIRSMRSSGKATDETQFEILVAGGTYKPSYLRTTGAAVDQDQKLYSFVVPQGVSIYGGFSGTEKYSSSSDSDTDGFTNIGSEVTGLVVNGEITDILADRKYSDFNQNNILEPWELANQTILSGNINASSAAQNAYHVVFTEKGTATTVNPVVLDGLTVMYGQTDDELSYSTNEDEQGRGGGIYSNGVTYTISRCRLLNNTAVRGGAVFVRNADLNLSGCILAGNKTVANTATGQTTTLTSRGGAAYVSGIDQAVNLRAVNTLWANNESAGEGGAIGTNYAEGISSSHDPLLCILNNTFVRNKADKNPVLYNHNAKSEFVNTLIWGNVGNSYDDATSVAEIYTVSHSASDVDYVGKFTSGNTNNNILLSTENMADNGPRFTNPSTVAGVDGNSASSLWNPVAISVLTDAGDGTEHTASPYPDETNHTDNTTTGAYQDWFNAKSTTTGYLGKNGVTEAYITGSTYSRYSGPRGENNEELCKPIDIGFYEYQYISNFSTMTAIYVDTISSGTGSGESWANATDDLRGAIVGAANPTQKEGKRTVYVRDGNYSWDKLSAGTAYILNMSSSKDLSESLTLKGSCTGSGDQQDFSKQTVLRNDGSTNDLMAVSANTKKVIIEGFTFINTTTDGTGMDASTGSGGSLTLKNCGFRISDKGLDINGNSGKMLIYNTLFADGGTGLRGADSQTTVVNATFANNTTADMTGTANVYNSVSWNNTAQNLPNGNYNVSIAGTIANDNVNEGPNFRDPDNTVIESRDYRIRPSVTLLNKGSNDHYIDYALELTDASAVIPTAEKDLGNNARLVDDDIDIGAYEYEAPLQPIVYVKADLTGTADGKSWETALGDLQGAVDLAGLYALNHKTEKANGYVFVHGNYHNNGSLNLSLGKTKVYGGMNDERSDEALKDDFSNVNAVVNSLLGKRKGMLEATNHSSLGTVTISADGVIDGFEVTGTAMVNNGVLSTSVVKNDVGGAATGLLYNSLVLDNVSGVKAVNVTATGSIADVTGNGNNRTSVNENETNSYVTDDYWKYQLMETSKDIDPTDTRMDISDYITKVGHSRDLIGNARIRNTVDNGCFETWNISSDYTITADDYPVGKSVVYVRSGKELGIEKASDGTLVYPNGNAFNPGFLLLEHQAGLRGNGNYISLTNFAVERDIPAKGADLVAMPFDVNSATSVLAELTPKRYDGSIRAAYDYKFDDGNSTGTETAWTETGIDQTSIYEGLLFENETEQNKTLRFYGKSTAPYTENGTDKSISLKKYNFNDAWTTNADGSINPGTSNRFTHKENMSWNLFGSPYLCAMNYSDLEYGRMLYGYNNGSYQTVNTVAEVGTKGGHIPAGSAVFTQTATLKDAEIFAVAQPVDKKSGTAFSRFAPVQVVIESLSTTKSTDQTLRDDIGLSTVTPEFASTQFDLGSDGVKWMAGDEKIPQIYMQRDGGRYSLLSAVNVEGSVEVGVRVGEPGDYLLYLPEKLDLSDYSSILLTDRHAGKMVDLKQGSYAFTATRATDMEGRFSLSFNRSIEAVDLEVKFYSPTPGVVIVEGLPEHARVNWYTTMGRLVEIREAANWKETFYLRSDIYMMEVYDMEGKERIGSYKVRVR